MTIIQNNLIRFRDYDPVTLPEHYCPVSHMKLSRAGIGGEAGVPAPDWRRTRLMRGVLLLVHEMRVEKMDFYGKKYRKTIGKLILFFINQVFSQHKLNLARRSLKNLSARRLPGSSSQILIFACHALDFSSFAGTVLKGSGPNCITLPACSPSCCHWRFIALSLSARYPFELCCRLVSVCW